MSPEAFASTAFAGGEAILGVDRHGHGLINDTYVVRLASGRRLLLQRINGRVFPHPEHIVANARTLSDHLAARRARTGSADRLRLPALVPAADGRDFVTDADGGFWRALEYLDRTRSYDTIENDSQAGQVGAALGLFHALLHDLPPERLHVTLPGFHDTPACLARFEQAAAGHPVDSAELRRGFAFVAERRELAGVLERARRAGLLAVRAVHGDPKLNNFLFDASGRRVVSLIDLDTVQPGLVHHDIGDCLRSCANPAGESPEALDAVRFDLDIARALLEGYLTEARGFLAREETALLYDAIRLLPFELGLRFLTDHLQGDVYFRTAWRGQNLHRALAQFRLLEDIERNGKPLRALVAGLARA
ncbi:aminoglycoside phosphotransferase [Sulfurifustis variabilis]|uniref:Aminoglycoside phosphotransferase n=1 Tax=Sulfurifustis variabilis TaxID=1675686 RepID=A0A1B4V855_9GAMM|nr:aminoglycoside phosphotransferase family protein [Sulfurifustis variabilis]BAU47574.1 aminoglycoside phosphotransferase [Sulfurifustis variabilis]